MKFRTGLTVALILMGAQSVSAASYYVSTTGNDPGTKLDTWRTIQKAANTLQAGDVVFIRGGTYVALVKPANSGAPVMP